MLSQIKQALTLGKGMSNKKIDNVNSPSHYNQSGIECIQAIEASMTRESLLGYYKGNIMKYLWRYEYKNQLEDLKKANWYLARMIERYEAQD